MFCLGGTGRLEETMIQMAQRKCGSVLKCLENETVYCRCTQEHTNWILKIYRAQLLPIGARLNLFQFA